MQVYLYFPPHADLARDELEDAIEAQFGERGEVTGGGSGDRGSNVDIEIADSLGEAEALRRVMIVLRRLKVPPETKIVLNGRRTLLGK